MMNRVKMGVTFGDTHSYNDLGLILATKSIGFPEVKTRYIEIPGRDGDIDESELLTGRPNYGNRDIKVTFLLLDDLYEDWQRYMSDLGTLMHGQKMKIIFDDDPTYYYIGRYKLDPIETNKKAGKVSISIKAEPYKYPVSSSDEPWLWDPFDFLYGVINESNDIEVDGIQVVTFDTYDKPETLTVTSSADMQMEYEGRTYQIYEGKNVLYSVILYKGTHHLTFRGHGTVTINWVGGKF